jgi:hypothetical protein
MSYRHSGLGQIVNASIVKVPLSVASAGWRVPIEAAAQTHFRAVAAARQKMPAWASSAAGQRVLRVASEWVADSRTKSLDQLKLKASFWAPISPVSMPATRYRAQAERDAVVASQAALKALVSPAPAARIPFASMQFSASPPEAPKPSTSETPKAAVDAATENVVESGAKLATDVETAQKATNPQTKAAADNVVAAQAEADAAAKAAQETAAIAQAASDAADAARSVLEETAAATNDVAAQQAITDASMTVAVSTAGTGPLGIPWKFWGIGAAVLVGGYVLLNTKALSSNRRKRVRRNRRRIAR